MTDLAWVPESCTLPTEEQPLRLAEWDALFAEQLARLERPGALRLRLHVAGGDGVLERVRDLAARESGCCSFFAFTVTAAATGAVVLEVEVDAAHTRVLDALQARAAAAAGGAS